MATSPPSATATPMSGTLPWLVVACSSTMECPAASAAAGQRVLRPGQRGQRPVGRGVLRRRGASGWSDAGESNTMTQATTAMTAPTPTRTMTALR